LIDFELLRAEVARHPYPLLFTTVSGAHLYGFPSPDSDYDLRGAHILPAQEAVGYCQSKRRLSFRAYAAESKWTW
jgi:predicted nucleotidyltransferase